MRHLAFAIFALCLLAGPAAAQCQFPGVAGPWQGAERNSLQSLCLQHELAAAASDQAAEAAMRAEIAARDAWLQLQLQQQHARQLADGVLDF